MNGRFQPDDQVVKCALAFVMIVAGCCLAILAALFLGGCASRACQDNPRSTACIGYGELAQ